MDFCEALESTLHMVNQIYFVYFGYQRKPINDFEVFSACKRLLRA